MIGRLTAARNYVSPFAELFDIAVRLRTENQLNDIAHRLPKDMNTLLRHDFSALLLENAVSLLHKSKRKIARKKYIVIYN